jgi:hypothetical protein
MTTEKKTEPDLNRRNAKTGMPVMPTRGGVRDGAGRPKGSTTKVTARDLIEQAQATLGKSFIVSLMEGYQDSITDGDRKTRVIYEKMILDKIATTMIEAEVTDSEATIDAKQAAFRAALAAASALATTVVDQRDK